MDRKDFVILYELFQNPFETYEKIGERAGIRGVSVRSRIIKMKKTGILQGIHLIPSPLCFQRTASSYIFTNVANVSSKLSGVLSVNDVVFARFDHRNNIIVDMYYKSENDKVRNLTRLSEILGDNYFSTHTPLSLLPPKLYKSGLSSIDWKLLEHMVSNPRSSDSELSRITHLSRKTVGKHRANMAVNRKVYPVLISDFTKGTGHIIYGVVALFENQETLNLLSSIDVYPVWIMNEPNGAYLLGFAGSLLDVEIIKDKIEKIGDVRSFSISIPAGGAFATERVKLWIREAIYRWKISSFTHS